MLDFLCIGAQKSGTTLLYEHLKEIDELFLPEQKELHFFDDDESYTKGSEWYFRHFANAKSRQKKGEITPAYIFFEDVPYRIKKTLGDNVKFILLLRNPVDRAYSQYNMSLLTHKSEKLSFEQAIMYEQYRFKDYRSSIDHSYVSRGFYSKQILNYFRYFNRSNFKFILYEDLVEDQNKYVNEILDFLGVSKKVNIENKVVFKNEYSLMDESTKYILKKIYEEEIMLLENLLNIDLNVWRQM